MITACMGVLCTRVSAPSGMYSAINVENISFVD